MAKGRAEPGSSKWLANKMKAKGLQKLRWYCQMCSKVSIFSQSFKCFSEFIFNFSIFFPAMSRSERIQVSYFVRITSKTTAFICWKTWPIFVQFFSWNESRSISGLKNGSKKLASMGWDRIFPWKWQWSNCSTPWPKKNF